MSIASINSRIQELQAKLERLETAAQMPEKGEAPERAPRKSRRSCRPLTRAKVLAQIHRLPAREKGGAMERLMCPRRRRHGSDAYARAHPLDAVREKEKLLMRRLHKLGLSFRALEEVFRLIPNSGNDAQRCVREAETLHRRKVAQDASRRRALAS